MTRSAKIVDAAALRARIRALELGLAVAPDSGPPGTGGAVSDDGSGVDAVPLGVAELDDTLPWGGLPRGALHELEPAADDMADSKADDTATTGALSGFAAALAARLGGGGPVLWCLRRCDLYAPGLPAFGLDPARLIVARAKTARDALWVLEEGLRSGVCGAVLGEIEKLDLTASRRLQLAARAGGSAGLLLYRGRRRQAGLSAAVTRWRIAAQAGAGPVGFDELGRPCWRVELARCRGGAGVRRWLVEWCHETNRFTVAAAVADRDRADRRRAV